LYVTCFTCNNIYVVANGGETSLFSGNGVAGNKDGSLKEAQFNAPNSIAITNKGDIYVSEFSANRIRKITGAEK
jgi:hypothetical protein